MDMLQPNVPAPAPPPAPDNNNIDVNFAALGINNAAVADGGGSNSLQLVFDSGEMVQHLCSFLSLRDMRAFRLVNRHCNHVVCKNPVRREHCKAVMSASWHKRARGMTLDGSFTWKYFDLRRFRFYKHSSLFRVYWLHVAQNMTHLNISDTSLECNGFAWIMNNTPRLHTLILNNTKLRDFTYQHAQRDVFPHKWAGDGIFPKPLRSLTIENTADVETCFLEYLVQRTGSLTSFNLGNCFYKNEQESLESQQFLRTRFSKFQAGFSKLIRANAGTLKNLTFRNNAFQRSYFSLMTEINDAEFYPQELHVEFPKDDYNPLRDSYHGPENYFESLVQFLRERGRDLAHLTLHFNRPFMPVELDRILVPVRKSLVTLSIKFYGDLLGPEMELANLNEMELLESFEVRDLKQIGSRIVKQIRMERDPVLKAGRLTGLSSKVAPSFLARLPNNLNSLSIEGLITNREVLSALSEPEAALALTSFQNLTKFEVIGPWMHPVNGLIEVVCFGMPRLRTLVLTNCFIFDKDISGLSATATKELKKSHTHLYGVLAPPNVPGTGEYFEKALAENTTIDGTAPRPSLARLTDLEHLDLSRNRISDIALAESVRIPTLKTLNLANCPRVTDNGLELIARNMPNLEVLNVRNVRKLTKYGMNRVVCSCKKLRRLYTTKTIVEMQDNFLTFDGWSPNFDDVVRCPKGKKVVEKTDEAEQDGGEDMEIEVPQAV